MKVLICGVALSLGMLATDAQAEQTVTIEGKTYALSTLMENCKTISNEAEAQLACFNAVSQLLKQQTAQNPGGAPSVGQAFETLRDLAEFKGEDSGLMISGEACNIQVVYYANYFHISRRNVSAIDLFSAEFDASKLQYDKISEVRGAQAPLNKAMMQDGATATSLGGASLESNQLNFAPKTARKTIDAYAVEVAAQLPATEDQAFDFVLVHPEQKERADQIWNAFETYVMACQA